MHLHESGHVSVHCRITTMKRIFGLCTGLALMLSTVGCHYYPGHFDPSTGLVYGGSWAPAPLLVPLNPFCWFGGCGGWYGGPACVAPEVGYGAPAIGSPTYAQPAFAPSYGGGGCSDCTSSPTYAPGQFVAPPSNSPSPAVPTPPTSGQPGSSTGSATWVVPTPVPAAAAAPPQTAGQPMWIPARY